jgi:hypothetical protein
MGTDLIGLAAACYDRRSSTSMPITPEDRLPAPKVAVVISAYDERDKRSGCRVYRAPALGQLAYGGDDFAFLPEMLVLAKRGGLRVGEAPIHFIYAVEDTPR